MVWAAQLAFGVEKFGIFWSFGLYFSLKMLSALCLLRKLLDVCAVLHLFWWLLTELFDIF